MSPLAQTSLDLMANGLRAIGHLAVVDANCVRLTKVGACEGACLALGLP